MMTSGKEISEKELRIYPNPASSVLRLSGWEVALTMEIYNTGGSCVLKAMAGPEIMIDQLPNDVYYLKVVNHRGENTVLPFIKAD
ncbi:MAG: T9SS type A sorting domain-containing protein [Saprospiraceae bacterium]|nr:T9SS type A sorting domain-containing protein [Saprospiraceae bacterium]